MKNLFFLSLIATILMVACGPSAEDKEAAEKRTQDSLAAVKMAAQFRQDSIDAAIATEKLRQKGGFPDSVAQKDSLAGETTKTPK